MPRRIPTTLLVLGLLATGGCGVHEIRGELAETRPDLPLQEKDYVDVAPQATLGLSDTTQVQDGQLKGPHFNLTISAVAVRDYLEPHEASALLLDSAGLRAARAHELVLVQMDTTEDRPPPWDPDGAALAASLVVDGVEVPFDVPGDWDSTIGVYFVQSTVVVVSVPKGRDALLRVTDEGVAQTIDLRTGKRATDAVPLLYTGPSQTLAVPDYAAAGVVGAVPNGVPIDRPYTVTFDFEDDTWADLSPWAPGAGWAVPGAAWLTFGGYGVTSDGITTYEDYDPVIDFTMDVSATFSLTMPDGTVIPAFPGTIESVEYDYVSNVLDPSPYGVKFGVPETFDTGTITVQPNGVMLGGYLEGDVPAGWLQPPAPLTIPVDLS